MTEQEFSRLAGLYRISVYRAAYCYTKNSADAEDITQEAFFKLFTAGTEFESDEKAKAWLIRTAINRCKDLRKSLRYRLTVQEEAAEAVCSDQKAEDSLLPVIMKLKPKSRCVLYMYYYEEYSVKEIAGLLGEKKTTVTTRLMRARKQLKELLLKEGYYEL